MRTPRIAAAAVLLTMAAACGRSPEKSASTPRPTAAPLQAAQPSVDAQDVTSRQRRPPEGRAPVIWLGLDGLDWELLDRLSREGKMPHWQRLTSEGYTAKLRSYLPVLSPIIWTTLATGVGPDVHRVLDFQEVDPASGQKVPISGRSRAVPAIWNVASASGVSVGVVGWWGSHPAEEVQGFFVSDHASPILFEGLPRQGLAYPASLSAGVEQIVAREGEVSDQELARYVEASAEDIARARASGEGLKNPIIALARTIAATRIQSRIARELYDRNLPDLMMLYLEGTDVVGHIFASYVPPKLSCVSDEDFARYRNAVDEYYALVDRILGQWMRRAEEDGATLIVNSDHGFKWGADRSCLRDSLNPSTAGFWHRLDGVFAAWGKRVKRSSVRGNASVFDVAPTVSALLSLPVERRASGKVVKAAFSDLAPPPRRDLSAIPVRRLSIEPLSEKEASEYMQKLRALGYLSGSEPGKLAPSGGDRPGMTEGAWNNLGLYFSVNEGHNDFPAAEAAYKKALELRPDYHSPQFNLAMLYRRLGKDGPAIDWLFRSLETGHADPTGTVLEWSGHYASEGKTGPEREVLERAVRKYPQEEALARPLAIRLFQEKDCAGAEAAVAPFAAATRDPDTLNVLGLLNTCLGRPNEAIGFFQRSLAVKPDQPGAIRSLDLLQKGLPSGQKQP
ncbi:MAG TPA: alkaline phosphatase family protein [Thermoanaerobaculia bacterium]|nr:alkaline phosphatase family protein [Thermoanaerobaculia bacterium]